MGIGGGGIGSSATADFAAALNAAVAMGGAAGSAAITAAIDQFMFQAFRTAVNNPPSNLTPNTLEHVLSGIYHGARGDISAVPMDLIGRFTTGFVEGALASVRGATELADMQAARPNLTASVFNILGAAVNSGPNGFAATYGLMSPLGVNDPGYTEYGREPSFQDRMAQVQPYIDQVNQAFGRPGDPGRDQFAQLGIGQMPGATTPNTPQQFGRDALDLLNPITDPFGPQRGPNMGPFGPMGAD